MMYTSRGPGKPAPGEESATARPSLAVPPVAAVARAASPKARGGAGTAPGTGGERARIAPRWPPPKRLSTRRAATAPAPRPGWRRPSACWPRRRSRRRPPPPAAASWRTGSATRALSSRESLSKAASSGPSATGSRKKSPRSAAHLGPGPSRSSIETLSPSRRGATSITSRSATTG